MVMVDGEFAPRPGTRQRPLPAVAWTPPAMGSARAPGPLPQVPAARLKSISPKRRIRHTHVVPFLLDPEGRIFCSDPDATDSFDDEDDQNTKVKKMVREVLVPLKNSKTSKFLKTHVPCGTKDMEVSGKKGKSSRFRGVHKRPWGRWASEIRDPMRKTRKWISSYDSEEAAATTNQAYANQFCAEVSAMKAQQSVSECAVLSSSSSVSCVSSSAQSEQTVQEVQNIVFMEIEPEPVDDILLNFSPTPKEISMHVFLGPIDETPVSNSVMPAEEFPLDDFPRLEAAFPINDFIGATHEPLDDDYIGCGA
ncbi:hypothetical protein BAE44_0024751 [Dichanthelium oligosanthes]|uniref:AP2/ERF domain-containing protein n=1 Tax=Dichanthelium oligosanthes TaxID=888268 RepID=A0A1E5UMX5_9POAL|nr:hypothetical protein BAE44_0024751 [Dichanthelium oligosanthes]